MAAHKGRTSNTNDAANVVAISVGDGGAVTLSPPNSRRIHFHVDNGDADKGVWIRMYPASQDNTKRGIYLGDVEKSKSEWEMPTDNPYTGEISAIAEEDTHDVFVTEW